MTYSLIKTITESDDELYRSGQSYPNNAEAKVLVYREGNTTNNYSNVRTEIWEKRLSSYVSFNYNTQASMKIYGTSYSANVSFREIDRYVWQKVWENTKKYIYHKSDGTRIINIEASFNTGTSDVGNIILDSIAIELPTIPRASTPSLDDSSVMMRDQTVIIDTNRLSTAFEHTIKYSFGAATGTIGTDVTDSVAWMPPIDMANQIPNSVSGSGTIICETYNGDDLIGTKSIPITLSVPSDIVPTIDSTSDAEAVSGLAAKFGGYVQGKSKINAVMTGSGAYGSTIQSNTIKIDGITYVGLGITSEFLQSSGTIAIEYMVKDSRNRSTTTAVNVSVYAYSNPSPTAFTAYRCDAAGIADAEGSYARVDVQAAISPVGDSNDIAYRIKYKKTSESTYTTVNLTSTAYSIDTSSILSSIDVNSRYDIVLEVQDYFMTAPREVVLPTAFTLADFLSDGTGMAIGKVSENSDEFDVNLTSRFRKAVRILAGLTVDNFRSSNTNEASLSSANHAAQIGDDIGENLIIDNTSFQARDNGEASLLDINKNGGAVHIGGSEVVSSGSNANGFWVRYYDGTQIVIIPDIEFIDDCDNAVGSSGTYRTPLEYVTSPVAFVDEDVSASLDIKSYARWGNAYTLNGTTFAITEYSGTDGATAYDGCLLAKGRWK